MIGYVTYLAVQQQTAEHALDARPNAPRQYHQVAVSFDRTSLLRRNLSGALRSLADRVEPRPAPREPVVAGAR